VTALNRNSLRKENPKNGMVIWASRCLSAITDEDQAAVTCIVVQLQRPLKGSGSEIVPMGKTGEDRSGTGESENVHERLIE
jgi:hypothetical protein